MEYQAYILSEKQFLNYLSFFIGINLGLTNSDNEDWSSHSLFKEKKKIKEKSPDLWDIISSFAKDNPDIADAKLRKQVSHYKALVAPQIEFTQTGWGAISLRYLGDISQYPGNEEEVLEMIGSLFTQPEHIAGALTPKAEERYRLCVDLMKRTLTCFLKLS